MEKRYVALRTIGNIYRVLGIIAGAITILAVLFICGSSLIGGASGSLANQYGGYSFLGTALGGLLMGLIAILYGGLISLTLYGMGEGVYLLIALEENTRLTATLLQQGK
jgi:hypothetical protein